MKTVTILGLYRAELSKLGIKKAEDLQGEIWSLNDWYRTYPWLPGIDRIYQLHGLNQQLEAMKTEGMHDRFPGDWKKKYRENAKVLVVDDPKFRDFLGMDVKILQYDRIEKKYGKDLDSTISIMLADAVEEGFEKINLFGVYMMGTHHVKYVRGVVKVIEKARAAGVTVNSNMYGEWKEHLLKTEYGETTPYITRCRKIEAELTAGI